MTLLQPTPGVNRQRDTGDRDMLPQERKPGGSLSDALASHLPALRRWAAILAGSQHSGDAYVRATLSSILSGDRTLIDREAPRLSLFRLLYAIWSSATGRFSGAFEYDTETELESSLGAPTVHGRVVLTLVLTEGFTPEEADVVVGRTWSVASFVKLTADPSGERNFRISCNRPESMYNSDRELILMS